MTDVNSADLNGAALDWAVALATGKEQLDFSTNWSQGGPLIDEYNVSIIKEDGEDECAAYIDLYVYYEQWDYASRGVGQTRLIAAMRCIVIHRLGETVEVPAEFLTQK
jgi:hypothetical protein